MRLLTTVAVALMCLLCACSKSPEAAKVIEKAEAGETLTDEDIKVLTNYVNSAMTSDEAKAVNDATNKALTNPSPQATAEMQKAAERMEKAWPLLQQASVYMLAGGALQPIDGMETPMKSEAPAN